MDIHLQITGVLLIALALMHAFFPKYFDWKKELSSLNVINRQMMLVHTFFIALVVFLMGVLCLTSTTQLIATNLGRKISLGFGIFWTFRLLIQLFGYSSELWKGKRFETVTHVLFLALWIYLSLLFLMIYFI